MALSIFNIGVMSYQRTLRRLSVWLDRGLAHSTERGFDSKNIKFIRPASNMEPFYSQFQAAVHHCLGGVKALKKLSFGPIAYLTYTGLKQLVGAPIVALDAVEACDNESAEQAVTFRHGELALLFTTGNFVVAFSLPNLYSHATTAYAILRMRGVSLGKSITWARYQLTD